jgi:hypothetical protein
MKMASGPIRFQVCTASDWQLTIQRRSSVVSQIGQ